MNAAHAAEPNVDCEHLLTGAALSAEAIQAISEAKAGFEIRVLTRVRDDRAQVIVLAGETHVKGSVSAELGKKLVRHFPVTAKEGVPQSAMNPFFNLQLSLLESLPKMISGLQGSTIDFADKRSVLQEGKFKAAADIASQIRDALSQGTLTASETEARIAKECSKYHISVEDLELSPEELVLAVKAELGLGDEPTQYRNIWLEEGHKPGLREKLSQMEVPILLGLIVGHHLIDHLGLEPNLITALNYVNQMISAYLLAELALKGRYSATKWFRTAFPLTSGLLDGRNTTMVENLVKAADQDEFQNVLVLVGRRHVPGMAELLKQKGFKDLPLN